MPKANIFKSSEVFKHLNEEAMKTRADKEKEVKRWTTFLQKPNRPIPKPKSDLDKPYQEPYRVRIVKQPKPQCDPMHVPVRVITPIDTIPNDLNEKTNTDLVVSVDQSLTANLNELKAMTEPKSNGTLDIIDINDDDVPCLVECNDYDAHEQIESPIDDSVILTNGDAAEINGIDESNGDVVMYENGIVENQPDYANPDLENQLANVQKQLEALSHLPSTIQATLEAVTRQIAEIMPAFKIRTSVDITGNINEESSIKLTEEFDASRDAVKETEHKTNETEKEIITTDSVSNDVTFKEHSHCTLDISTNQANELVSPTEEKKSSKLPSTPMLDMIEVLASNTEEQVTKLKIEKCFKEQEDKWLKEREHVRFYIDKTFFRNCFSILIFFKLQAQKSVEEQHHTIAESAAKNAKSSKLNNGIRTPQERPMVLPGGRKWRNPKDAYNEEFIAEIISSQAELITGSTLG